jgi:phage repressor protein C with HTH and peptisase S24 domain
MSDFMGNIFQFREKLGLSRVAFAEPLGVSPDKIKHIETGKQRADHEILAALRTVYGVDLNTLLTGEIGDDPATIDDPSFVTVPKYTVSASAGDGGSFVAEPLEVSYYAFNIQWIKRRGLDPSQLQIVTVKGDSMEPKLLHGDLILVDRSQATPSDGSTYVVRICDELVVKHVQRIGRQAISLISANKVYPPREIDLVEGSDTDFEIIGRVVASMHEWS